MSEYQDLAGMTLFSVVDDFESLEEFLKDFEKARRVYTSNLSSQMHEQQKQEYSVRFVYQKRRMKKKTLRLVVRPDTGLVDLDPNVESFEGQLSDLMIFFRQSRNNKKSKESGNSNGKTVDNRQNTKKRCLYCTKPGHYANQCPHNPHRNTICYLWGMIGHIEAT